MPQEPLHTTEFLRSQVFFTTSVERDPRTAPLYVDLVPCTARYSNMRDVLTATEWQRVKEL